MPSPQRVGHLRARLADAGEDDLVGRHAGGPGAAQLALGHHVHAGAEAGQGGDHGLVGVGLDGVADQRVEAGERLLQHAVVPLQRRRRVAVEGGADLLGDAREAHVLRVEDAADVAEVVHVSGSAGRGWRVCAARAGRGCRGWHRRSRLSPAAAPPASRARRSRSRPSAPSASSAAASPSRSRLCIRALSSARFTVRNTKRPPKQPIASRPARPFLAPSGGLFQPLYPGSRHFAHVLWRRSPIAACGS